MRQITFRGKTIKGGRWIFGDLLRTPGNTGDGVAIQYWDKESGWMNEDVKADTIGQFTGLYDKQQNPVYESDIIECVSWNEFWSRDGKPLEQLRRRLLVGFRHGAFVCVERQAAPFDDKVWDIISNQDCIIIGNIHDNPDLFPKKDGLL